MNLDGRTVFVTGAAAGIGRAIAQRCSEAGARVIITDVDSDGGAETVARIESAGGEADFRELDVRDAEAFAVAIERTTSEHGPDVLVNNAGIGHQPASLEDTDLAVRDRVMEINALGMWNGCRAVLPGMKARGSGAIVNVSSLAGLIGLPTQAAYSLSKGAVVTLTKAIAAEAGPHGVRANAVCPGFVDTDLVGLSSRAARTPGRLASAWKPSTPSSALANPKKSPTVSAFSRVTRPRTSPVTHWPSTVATPPPERALGARAPTASVRGDSGSYQRTLALKGAAVLPLGNDDVSRGYRLAKLRRVLP